MARISCLLVTAIAVAMSVGQPCWSAAQTDPKELSAIQAEVIRSGASKESLDRLEKIISTEPKNAQAHYVFGLALKKAGYDELAQEQFQQVNLSDPHYGDKIADEFRQALSNEDVATAVEHEKFMRDTRPNDPSLLYLDGLMHREGGKLDEATRSFSGAIRSGAPIIGLPSALASIYVMRGDYEHALRMVDGDLRQKPNHHEANVVKGEALMGLKRYNEAIEPLGRAFQARPGWPGSGRLYASVLVKTGRYSDALEPCFVDLAVEARKPRLEQTKFLTQQALNHSSTEQVAAAIKKADATLQPTGQAARMYFALADVYDRIGDFRDACVVRAEGLHREPNYTRGYYRMGQSLERAAAFDSSRQSYADLFDAVQFYKKAYEHEPGSEDYLYSYYRARERFVNRDNDLAWKFKDWLQHIARPEPAQLLKIDKAQKPV